MLVSEVMVKNVVTAEKDEPVTKVLKKMEDGRIHQLPVVLDGKVLGMVFLKEIIRSTRDVKKNTAGQFLTKIPHIDPKASLQEAVGYLMRLGVRAIPVVEGGKLLGIVSESDLIKYVEFLEDISPDKLMTGKIFAVRKGSKLGGAISLMSEQNISRIPVADEQDRVIGCIDNLSLIKFLRIPKESVGFSHLTATEQTSAKEFPVEDYMRKTSTMEVADFSLKKIIELLQSHEEVVITEKSHPVGIITPRDILELAVMEEEVPIEIARIERVDPYDKSRLDDTLRKFVKKIDKMIPVQRFFIYLDTHDEGGRKKYSMRANLVTDKETFRANSHGWDIWTATHMLLDNLERQIMRHRGKEKKRERRRSKY